jgi:hypothetical protein
MTTMQETITARTEKSALDVQIERVGWALFLIMIGALALLPKGLVPAGTWLVGTGVIMVGLSVVRHLKGIRLSGFSVVVGLVVLALGISALTGVDLPVLAIVLVAVGLHIVYSALVRR